jgi:hypothetical protein
MTVKLFAGGKLETTAADARTGFAQGTGSLNHKIPIALDLAMNEFRQVSNSGGHGVPVLSSLKDGPLRSQGTPPDGAGRS